MRTDYIDKQELQHLLAALMPPNRLAMELSLATGLRLGDVLNLRLQGLLGASKRRLTIRELKTGKRRRFTIPPELLQRALAMAGKIFVFEHRLDQHRSRTRQAVWKDLKRIARAFRLKPNLAPHSARKVWAVAQYRKNGSLARVQKLMNHSSASVTTLYALADQLTKRKRGPL